MTDIEMTKLCAEAMGYTWQFAATGKHIICNGMDDPYDPLNDDAQAMALVKKLRLTIELAHDGWWVCAPEQLHEAQGTDLNRCIVECVAKLTKKE